MFDASYDFRYINHREANKSEHFQIEHKLTFTCQHKHRYDMYVVKFHLKAHTDSPNRYRLLTGYRDATRIISTCIKIMLFFYQKNPLASFGFIGARIEGEAEESTKRFRVYKRAIENLISPIHFEHYTYVQKSAYLLLNKNSTEENLLSKLEKMFEEFYEFPA